MQNPQDGGDIALPSRKRDLKNLLLTPWDMPVDLSSDYISSIFSRGEVLYLNKNSVVSGLEV